jgi:hypothetical protein
MVGVVVASARGPIAIDPLSGTVLSLLGLQLSAGITTARLRRELLHAEMERERRTLAAEVHDGLAQHLAVALRELALLDAGSPQASRERLRESITVAHRLVRARLRELMAPAPLGGLRDAIEQSAERARRRGLAVTVTGDADAPGPEAVSLVTRVVAEALANVDAHAHASVVDVRIRADSDQLAVDVVDDGCGFDPAAAPGVGDGHLGLTVMRERARAYGGDCRVEFVDAGRCPHVAMLLRRPEDVAPTLASFYALGAKRNGWLYHRALAGSADGDRETLTAAGLEVAALEAAGRMVIAEIDLDISVEDYVHAWEPQMRAALARGFDAAWWARFPIGPDERIIERSVEYDRAWDDHFRDLPCVSLCLFVVGEIDAPRVAQVGATHDGVLVPTASGPAWA